MLWGLLLPRPCHNSNLQQAVRKQRHRADWQRRIQVTRQEAEIPQADLGFEANECNKQRVTRAWKTCLPTAAELSFLWLLVSQAKPVWRHLGWLNTHWPWNCRLPASLPLVLGAQKKISLTVNSTHHRSCVDWAFNQNLHINHHWTAIPSYPRTHTPSFWFVKSCPSLSTFPPKCFHVSVKKFTEIFSWNNLVSLIWDTVQNTKLSALPYSHVLVYKMFHHPQSACGFHESKQLSRLHIIQRKVVPWSFFHCPSIISLSVSSDLLLQLQI